MATAKKTPAKKAAPAKSSGADKPAKTTGTEIANWDEELAKYAQAGATQEANAGTGLLSFSLKSGVLSLDDNEMPNNEMAVIVLDHILENTFYLDAYDPDNPAPPSAYALGRDEDTMRWSEDSIEELPDGEKIAGELCRDSSINQWGSADTGRGKATRNLRRLLMIPAGKIDKKTGEFELVDDDEHFATARAAFMKLPPTSTTNWSNYVKSLAGNLNKPPFVVATRVKVVPDKKTQFKVTFEALEELPAELFPILLKRHKEAEQLIMQPYDMSEREEREAKPAARKAAAKKATGKAGRGKKY